MINIILKLCHVNNKMDKNLYIKTKIIKTHDFL